MFTGTGLFLGLCVLRLCLFSRVAVKLQWESGLGAASLLNERALHGLGGILQTGAQGHLIRVSR